MWGRFLKRTLGGLRQNLASVLMRVGHNEKAIGLCDKAIRIREHLVIAEGKSELAHDLAQAYLNKGNALLGLNLFADALVAYEAATGVWEKQVQELGRVELAGEMARAYCNTAAVLDRLNRKDDAIATSDKAIRIYGEQLTRQKRYEYAGEFTAACERKSNLLTEKNDSTAVRALYVMMTEVFDAIVRESHDPTLLGSLGAAATNAGSEHARAGDFRTAVAFFRKGISAYDEAYEKHNQEHLCADMALAKGMCAFALLNCGTREEAAVAVGEARLGLLMEYKRSKRPDVRKMLWGLCRATGGEQWFKKLVGD